MVAAAQSAHREGNDDQQSQTKSLMNSSTVANSNNKTSSVVITGLPEKLESNDHLTVLQRCMESGLLKGLDYQEERNRIIVNFTDNASAEDCYEKILNKPLTLANGSKLTAELYTEEMNKTNNSVNGDAGINGHDKTESNGKEALTTSGLVNSKNDDNADAAKRPKITEDEQLDYGADDQLGQNDNEDNLFWDNDAKTADKGNDSAHSVRKSSTDRHSQSSHSRSMPQKQSGRQSKVLHLRNLPSTYNKNDFCKLIFSFGKITHCIFMKSQAFVEMDRLDDAVNMIDYCAKYPLYYMDQKIIMQYSEHEKLRKNDSHSINNKMIETTLAYLWNDIAPHERMFLGQSVIMATVENMVYPVDIEALHQIFSKYGKVLKIRMIVGEEGFKALIQMENPYVARTAVQNTDNQNIYSDANLLRSKLYRIKDLIVRPGDPNAHDFTRMSLQPKPSLSNSLSNSNSRSFNQPPLSDRHANNSSSYMQSSMNDSSRNESSGQLVVLVSNLGDFNDRTDKKIDSLFAIMSTVGIVNRIKVLYKTPDRAFVEFATYEQANNAISLLNGVVVDSKKLSISMARIKSLIFKPTDNEKFHREFTRSKLHRFNGPNCKHLSNIFPPSAKLHLANLHESCKQDDIVPLFEKHGKVEYFSFMDKKHMAYIKFTDVDDAVSALIDLHGQVINGLTLKVSFAKQQ